MTYIRNTFRQAWQAIQISRDDLAEATASVVLAGGAIYAMWLAVQQDIVALTLFLPGLALLSGLANYPPLQNRLLSRSFNLRHVLHTVYYWGFGIVWLALVRFLLATPAAGKESQLFYVALLAFLGLTWAALRSLLVTTVPRAYNVFSTRIPLWEQVLLAVNEVIALGLMSYIWGGVLVRLFQPQVFTTRLNLVYGLGLGTATLLYYGVTQIMWVQRLNATLSRNSVWMALARVLSPFAVFVLGVLIRSRFTERVDPRTASLLDNADVDLAVLSLAPILLLLALVIMVLVYVSGRGLHQRFLPDTLLRQLPLPLRRLLEAISDIDLLLILGVLAAGIPVYLLSFGENSGVVGQARQIILQRGNALLETSEQALTSLFVLPFYGFIVLILLLYGFVISRGTLSADVRDDLMTKLPIGFLITMIITLYLFAVPFTQVFVEGRLPTPSRDLGRILVFYVLIPLLLLYLHFFLLVRIPYGRGQRLWRERYAMELDESLRRIDRRIDNLNRELETIDVMLEDTDDIDTAELKGQVSTLHRYIQLNGRRDNLNMERLQIVAARQNLSEISETPFNESVGRLPLRIISIGIPLLLLFQLYQWVILNQGLQEVINNPNITLADFIRILLDNIEF